jgi:probable phosphomutase (TIGR03848 family)
VTTVVLIRHGRTAANATGILAGRTPGVLLDAVGRRQARTLGTRMREVRLDALVHSPLERCIQTADGVLARRPEVARHTDERLSECDYGDWTGRALAELAKEPLWPVIQEAPSSVTFPGGESMLAMAQRAATAVADWATRHPEGVVAVVSHGDVIKAILSAALGQPLDEFQRIVVGPGSVSVVRYHGDRTIVLRMNDTGLALPVDRASGHPTLGGGAG